MQHRRSLLALAVGASMVIAACGDDDETAEQPDTTSTPAPPGTSGTSAPTATPGTSGTSAPTATSETSGAPTTGSGASTTPTSGEAVDLAGVCPEVVSIQKDWMPEAEHGFLYQMVGEGYEIDAGKAYVTGPLIDAGGNDTGVDIEIRSGGQPQNFSPVT